MGVLNIITFIKRVERPKLLALLFKQMSLFGWSWSRDRERERAHAPSSRRQLYLAHEYKSQLENQINFLGKQQVDDEEERCKE